MRGIPARCDHCAVGQDARHTSSEDAEGMTPRDRTARPTTVHASRFARPGGQRPATVRDPETESLLARIEQLEHDNAALQAFAGIAAHELMEPLVIAEAYATMVSERLDEDQHADSRRDLEMLSRAVSRTRLLLEALLNDARAGDRSVTRRPVDLNVLVGECAAMLAPEIRAREARLHVSELPIVSGDELLLSGLFANLLMNALKYSRREGAKIAVHAALE